MLGAKTVRELPPKSNGERLVREFARSSAQHAQVVEDPVRGGELLPERLHAVRTNLYHHMTRHGIENVSIRIIDGKMYLVKKETK